MASADHFDHNNDSYTWNHQQQRGFEDAYEGRGYHPPPSGPDAEITRDREDYDLGFQDGGYSVLEEAYPGISEATALMHTSGKSSQEDIIRWLLAPIEEKYRWDKEGHLHGYDLDGRTIYG